MEKALVQKHKVSWKEASDALGKARKALGIAAGKNAACLKPSEKDVLISAASQILEAAKEKRKNDIEARSDEIGDAERKLRALSASDSEEMISVIIVRGGCNLNLPRSTVPGALKSAGVTLAKWMYVHDMVLNTLVPAVLKSKEMDTDLKERLQSYVGQQWTKGQIGFGESGHEKKMLKLVTCASRAHSNTILVATNLLAKVNYMMAPHGILVQLAEETTKIYPSDGKKYFDTAESTLPVGLKFYTMGALHQSLGVKTDAVPVAQVIPSAPPVSYVEE